MAAAIRKGEELTVDYNFGAGLEKYRCHCGSPNYRELSMSKREPRLIGSR